MSLLYRAMYAVGFAPWDTGEISDELRALVEGPAALSVGRALDIGCGTGAQATYLALRGWQVTGIDVVAGPLGKAKRRATAAGVNVELLQADITRPVQFPRPGQYTLVHDRGCFHGLRVAQRAAYVRAVTTLTGPGGLLVLMSFARNCVLGGPAGADRDEVARSFGSQWRLVASTPDTDSAPRGPMHDVPRFWHRLIRSRSD